MIKIENLVYRYPTRDDFALQGVNLSIEKGEFILLTGPTGCGKSTLLKCLNGIIPHEAVGEFSGDVLIGGLNTRQHPIRVLAQKLGLVFQNPDEQIFSTRVLDEVAFGLENLCFPPPEIQTQVEWALARTGMQELVYRSTNALSGGQKQRLAIARALVRHPDVLIFDEATSHLDTATERAIQQNLRSEFDGKTVVMVAHRLSTIRDADQIVVMDGGAVLERGTHASLLARDGGAYARLWARQDAAVAKLAAG